MSKDSRDKDAERGVGKCFEAHLGSYGYPTRPEEAYPFCPQCGTAMVWHCPECGKGVPEDTEELVAARFCRYCGTSYFEEQKPSAVSAQA